MGSEDQNPNADADEFPQHRVMLDAFWISQTEVTNAMFAEFLNDIGLESKGSTPWLDTSSRDLMIHKDASGTWIAKPAYENYPVVEITWYGADAYCQWAGGNLPSEAQWEYAARGTDARIYPWGDDIDCEHILTIECRNTSLLPVASQPENASPFNALDMSGNVWEWTADWYASSYYTEADLENPLGPNEGTARVVRGGSWLFDARHARAVNRRNDGPMVSKRDYGFRCVMPSPMSHAPSP